MDYFISSIHKASDSGEKFLVLRPTIMKKIGYLFPHKHPNAKKYSDWAGGFVFPQTTYKKFRRVGKVILTGWKPAFK
jgi:hypothetical protein